MAQIPNVFPRFRRRKKLPREKTEEKVMPDFLSPRTSTDLVSVGLANVEILSFSRPS